MKLSKLIGLLLKCFSNYISNNSYGKSKSHRQEQLGLFYAAVTVTVHVAVLPFAVVAEIVAVPSATAVTLPLVSTLALALSVLDHVTVCEAPSGVTVAVKVSLAPFTS
ncbi:hypothetical protein KMD50_gp14 [Lactococcus phage PLgW-1]|uniref:Uncharacterized protein n=1 Tax=Lactococcus phage PLgW-1 TaxID=1983536 RepID=A0A2Z2GUJ0_9CAUD|nr:hypothetical protein KMD50_gp14 [Lactococcus phage PLgW-1]ARQ94825.1 hypothetical protein PLgW1_14 [Lactococcus phage PLgW-1]